MKLLYVIHQYFPDCQSGTEQYCLATSREARRRGDEVAVLSLHTHHDRDDPPVLLCDESYDGFRVLRLRHWQGLNPNEVLRDYQNPLAAAVFRRVLDDVQPDAVHFFHLRQLGADLLGVAADRGLRTVVHLMDFWYLCPRFTLLRRDGSLCEGPPDGGLGCIPCQYPQLAGGAFDDGAVATAARAFARAGGAPSPGGDATARFAALVRRKEALLARLARADAVIAPSRFLADMFARNGLPRERMRVVPYGLEPGRLEPLAVARPRAPLRLAFAGILSPWKSPHVAIEAVRQLAGADLQLTVHGPLEMPTFAAYIADLRERAGDDPRIRFAGEFGRDQLAEVLADTDLLLVPSTWYENTPFVILEAFAAGVPVIASDLGGMSELVEPGRNGFLFPAGDAAALGDVLRRCCDEPERVAALRPEPVGGIADNYDHFVACYRQEQPCSDG